MLVTKRLVVVVAFLGLILGVIVFKSARSVETVDLSSIIALPKGALVVESFQTEGPGRWW
ncbi:MAG: hypothetical protein ACRDRT_08100 [Pseudonocardiaceae bacterium]